MSATDENNNKNKKKFITGLQVKKTHPTYITIENYNLMDERDKKRKKTTTNNTTSTLSTIDNNTLKKNSRKLADSSLPPISTGMTSSPKTTTNPFQDPAQTSLYNIPTDKQTVQTPT